MLESARARILRRPRVQAKTANVGSSSRIRIRRLQGLETRVLVHERGAEPILAYNRQW